MKTLKFPLSPLLEKYEQLQLLLGRRPITQIAERLILQQPQNIIQPKTKSKSSVPESFIVPEKSQLHDKIIPVPDYIIPQTRSGYDSISRIIKRKNHTGY